MPMTSHTYQALGPHGFHRVHYTAWGDPANPKVLVCVHGLTRTARDFDDLAAALADQYRVICPDMVGRGQSDWLPDKRDYTYPLYLNDLATLLARLDAERVDWVGTSMGGLLGMFLASYPGTPVHHLVINDAGPALSAAALKQIAALVGSTVTWDSFEAMDRALRVFAPLFGPLTEVQWQRMLQHNSRQQADGRYVPHYDPGIADNFKTMEIQDLDLWPVWDAIRSPTLVLRGALSNVLTSADALAMTQRGPKAELIEFPGVGHAPALMSQDQITVVRDWLLRH